MRLLTCIVTLSFLASCGDKDDDGAADAGETGDGVSGWIDMDVGGLTSCALHSDGHIECWGYLDHACTELGQADACTPEGSFVDLDVGGEHACALDEAGQVTCWGGTDYGMDSVPDVSLAMLGDSFGAGACGLDASGGLHCWGAPEGNRYDYGQTSMAPDSGTWTAVATGTETGCGLDGAGEVRCWGGYGSTYDYYGQISDRPGGSWLQLSLGYYSGVVVDEDDEQVVLWGLDATNPDMEIPDDVVWRTIKLGSNAACGIDTDSSAHCWGSSTIPGLYDVPSDPMEDVALGLFHACGLTMEATVLCWGEPVEKGYDYGQISGVPE